MISLGLSLSSQIIWKVLGRDEPFVAEDSIADQFLVAGECYLDNIILLLDRVLCYVRHAFPHRSLNLKKIEPVLPPVFARCPLLRQPFGDHCVLIALMPNPHDLVICFFGVCRVLQNGVSVCFLSRIVMVHIDDPGTATRREASRRHCHLHLE